MSLKLFVLCIAITVINAQLFGGKSMGPGKSFNQNVGFQHGKTWGSLSQGANQRGKTGPINYGAGTGFNIPGGPSVHGSINHVPKLGSQTSVKAAGNLFQNDKHQVSAWAQHDRNLGRNWKPVGKEVNSAGIQYGHANGAGVSLSGSKSPGSPSVGTVSGSVPLANLGPARIDAVGNTNFAHGRKPEHQVGIEVSGKF